MTPALKLLKKNKLTYKVLEYKHDPQCSSYGEEAFKVLGLDPSRVFKTLIFKNIKKPSTFYTAVIPVKSKLSLKLAAKAVKVKKVEMALVKEAENITGYKTGGISPFGQKKKLYTILDESSHKFQTIFVSAGKRGMEMEIEPKIFQILLNCDIKKISN